MRIFGEFREFALKGSVIDLAVGIIIGAAFGAIVKSLVDDVLMPLIGLLTRGADFSSRMWVLHEGNATMPHDSPAAAKAAGYVTLNYGLFLNNILTFFLVALAVFFLVRAVNRARRGRRPAETKEVTEKACPFCLSTIPLRAVRCPQCTSEVPAVKAAK